MHAVEHLLLTKFLIFTKVTQNCCSYSVNSSSQNKVLHARTDWMVSARTRAGTIHKLNTPIPPPMPQGATHTTQRGHPDAQSSTCKLCPGLCTLCTYESDLRACREPVPWLSRSIKLRATTKRDKAKSAASQLVRASPLQGEGRGFESLNAHQILRGLSSLLSLVIARYLRTLFGELAVGEFHGIRNC